MLDVEVLDEPTAAAAVLDPVRTTILAALRQPASATSLARALGVPRQRVNYHVRELEQRGLVRLVETRQRRGLTERVLVASAESYVLSPAALGESAADPARTDRLSTRYLIAVAARMLRELGDLARRADEARRPLATLTMDTEIRFASARERARFTDELAAAVTELVGRYHDTSAPGGRWHRLIVAAHPRPGTPAPHAKE